MSRSALPFFAPDISALARSLNGQLARCGHLPSHLELLNMLARAVGCRNFQHLRAQLAAHERLESSNASPATVDYTRLERLVRYFDAGGRLKQWPSKFSDQESCLWVLWAQLPANKSLTESGINQHLAANHLFRDPALLRREMKDRKLVTRSIDGREYRRVERRPPAQALALIAHVGKRPHLQ